MHRKALNLTYALLMYDTTITMLVVHCESFQKFTISKFYGKQSKHNIKHMCVLCTMSKRHHFSAKICEKASRVNWPVFDPQDVDVS